MAPTPVEISQNVKARADDENQSSSLAYNEHLDDDEYHWFKHVYKGDKVPQLTLRAVVTGGIIGMFMSISHLYTTVKLGWGFGITITASIISYMSWNAVRGLSNNRISQMSILENNCMQSTASAAGYSTGGTLGVAFGAMLLITREHSAFWVVFAFVLFTAALGVFVAIPMKRQMINVEKLKFPSGIAAAEMLQSLYSEGAKASRKAYALIYSLFAGASIGLLRVSEGMVSWLDRIHHHTGQWLRIPELISFPNSWMGLSRGNALGFGFEPSALLIGAGIIVGLRVSLSMLFGALLLYCVVSPWLISHEAAMVFSAGFVPSFSFSPEGNFLPTRWGLWGGTSVMVFSSLTAVALQWKTLLRAFSIFKKPVTNQTFKDAQAVEVPLSWFFLGMLPVSVGLVIINLWAFEMSIGLSIVAIFLSFILALVACRATGETDTSPVGAMGKVTQLIYALLAKGNMTVNLMSAGTTSCAAGSAADLLTDLKSGYILGANPRKQFLAQFFGIFFGTLAIVPAWFLMFPDAKTLESYNPPAANMWKAVAEALTLGLHTVPFSARVAIVVGALIGILLPVLGSLFPKLHPYLPSAMGLGLSWVMPFQNSLSFAVGAIIGWLWLKLSAKNSEVYSVAIASGLIAGESLMASMVAMAVSIPGALAGLFHKN